MTLVAVLAVGYLLGAIPTAAWLARAQGAEIFKLGSGNMGAMNALRTLGRGAGLLVLLVDIAKGFAAVSLAIAMARWVGLDDPTVHGAALIAGFGAVLGHAYSVFVGWRGGKALATMFGAALPLYPWGALAGLLVVISMLLVTRSTHRAALVALPLYPLLVVLAEMRMGATLEEGFALFSGVVPLVVVSLLKHRRTSPPHPTP